MDPAALQRVLAQYAARQSQATAQMGIPTLANNINTAATSHEEILRRLQQQSAAMQAMQEQAREQAAQAAAAAAAAAAARAAERQNEQEEDRVRAWAIGGLCLRV